MLVKIIRVYNCKS